MSTSLELVAGLGNPGDRYARTYHNVGYRAVDRLVREWEATAVRRSADHLFETATGPVPFLGKPDAYVNRSGTILARWREDLGLEPPGILVVYDDFSLEAGRVRVRPGGGPGGHNGMEDVLEALGSEDVPRVRLGIGPLPPGEDPAEFVLSEVSKRHRSLYDRIFARLPELVEKYVNEGCEAVMNRWNGVDFRERSG